MKDFAIGLPDKEDVKKINPNLKGRTRIVFQHHKSSVDHYDMRIPDGDMLHSFVSRSLPGEKDKFLLVQQPTHRASYIDFEGTIPSGYGAGTVKKAYEEEADIIHADNNNIRMVLPEGEFSAIRLKGTKHWLMLKHNNTIPDAVTHKPGMKEIKPAAAEIDKPDTVWQPKIDGGHTLFRLKHGGSNRAYSYRTSKKTGRPIEHTHQIPDFRDAPTPKELDGVEFRGELYSKNQSGPLPPESVAGLLNAGTFRSRDEQAVVGRLRGYPFRVVRWRDGKNVENLPYRDQLPMLKELTEKMPVLEPTETAHTSAEKESLMKRIRNNEHPDTVEGVVEWDLNKPGGDPRKIKFRDSHEVVIRSIFPAESKRPIAGGFKYSWTPDSAVVGKVGTGFSEAQRRRMLSHPEEFIGRVARVNAQSVYGSGAMRAPSFYSMHIEKNSSIKGYAMTPSQYFEKVAGATAEYETAAKALHNKILNAAQWGMLGLPTAGAVAGGVYAHNTGDKKGKALEDRTANGTIAGGALGIAALAPAAALALRHHGKQAEELFQKFAPGMKAETGSEGTKWTWGKHFEDAASQSRGGGRRYGGYDYRGGSRSRAGANTSTKAHPQYESSFNEFSNAKTKDEAKSIYRGTSMKFHPDKQTGKSAAEKAAAEASFKAHGQAWEEFKNSRAFEKLSYFQQQMMESMFSEMEKMGSFCE